jgi:hypothetical protein
MLPEKSSKKRPYVPPRLIDLSGGGSNIAHGATVQQNCLTGTDHQPYDPPLDNPNCMNGIAPENNCLTGGAAIGRNCNNGSIPRA